MLRLRGLLASSVLLVLVFSTAAQDKVEFQWKLEEKKPFYQEMETVTTQSIKVQETPVVQTQRQKFYFRWEPIKKDGDKWQVQQTIEGAKMKIEIAGNPVEFDSVTATGSTALTEFFNALKDTKFTMTLGKGMKAEKVEGRDEFLKKLGNLNAQMEPLLKRILSDEAMKQMADPTFGVIPTEGKKQGETWETKATIDLGPIGKYENTYKYTYKGKDDKNKDLDQISVETSIKYSAPSGPEGGEGLPFKIVAADLKTKEKQEPGIILFNNKTGRLESSTLKIDFGGTLDISIGGNTTKVELRQEQSTTIKTGDKSFIPEKK